jgi:NAD-dependent DNA ligase/histidinol phosphatase-like enzyme
MNFNIAEINNDPCGFIKKNKKKDIIDFLMKADDAFFNKEDVLIKDDIYDIIKDYVYTKYPKDKYFKRIGAEVKNKVVLPYYMGSQNKIKDSEEEITKYKAKYPGSYVISDKLDGVSCLIVYTPNNIKMYTRGNGTEGQDITHLLPFINMILPPYNEKDIQIFGLNNTEIAVRGELIISKNNWDALGAMGKQGSNPRNTVAGAINSDILNKDILSKIDFVVYSLVHPQVKDAMIKLQELGFKTAYNIATRSLNLENLSKILETRRAESEYVIDGIVIEDTSKYYNIEEGKNPEHSFAFKSIHTLEQVEVMVSKVEWNVSKDMYMKPIVMFKEIDLDGVKIKQATGFNASYIVKNVIGPGSRIIIIRSGNVIPHIHGVLTPSATGSPSMPGIEGEDYIWNDTRVDIMLTNKVGERNRDYDIKNLTYFMKTANIEYMGPGNIAKLYDAGFVDIKMIAHIKMDDLLKIDGIKEKGATNIITALAEIRDIECLTLMDASNIMGRGFSYKKIKIITDMYPHILHHDKKSRTLTSKLTPEDLMLAEGIAETSATLFLSNLPKFYDFYDNLGIKCKSPNDAGAGAGAGAAAGTTMIDTNILGKSFVFTGFRDKELEVYIIMVGGFVKTTISKNTDYLVVADMNDTNNKTEKATSLGVPIILRDNSVFAKMRQQSSRQSPSQPSQPLPPKRLSPSPSPSSPKQQPLPSPKQPLPSPSPPLQSLSLSPPKQHQQHQQHQQSPVHSSVPSSHHKHLFKERPQGGEDRFTMITRFTLITFANSFRPTKGKSVKVIFADLDHTLITPKGKHVFPKTIDDWKWKNDAIVPKLKDLYNNMGYEIVIVSNQKKMTGDDVRTKATMIYNDLQIPFVFISGHSDLYYRKPQLGLWEVLGEYIFNGVANIDPSSVFIGDSVADLYFARNTNTKFIHTDMFFNGVPNTEFAKIEEREHPLTQWVSKKAPEMPSFKSSQKHLVIMVGSPASGKSYYSGELERKGFIRINKDTMKNDKVAMKAFEKGLGEGRNIVIDNTNPTKEGRALWISLARKESYNITIVWMNFPIPVVEYLDNYRIAMNKSQDTHVPAVGMRVYYKKLEAPTQQECDNLYEVKTIKAGEMLSVWL